VYACYLPGLRSETWGTRDVLGRNKVIEVAV
jgi:hypothetical protein